MTGRETDRTGGAGNRVFALDVRVLSDPGRFMQEYEKQRPERRERVDRMRFDSGKRQCLGAGMVTERALRYAGCADEEIVLTPEGKPTVTGCFFNISHTGDIVVGAVSDREVGIDIERPRELREELIRRVFTPDEIRMAEAAGIGAERTEDGTEGKRLTGSERTPGFFTRLWTIKESVMKWCGLGLGLMPEHIEVCSADPVRVRIRDFLDCPGDGAEQLTVRPGFDLLRRADELRFTFFRHGDYRITVCSEYDRFAEEIDWI